MGTRRLWGARRSMILKSFRKPTPTAMATMKKATILTVVMPALGWNQSQPASSPPEAKPVRTERMTMPRTSSMTAAAMMEVPTFPSSFPSSFKTATVTETEVAVRIAP